ncbi:serine/threonine protein kinase [Bacteroidota bacterium]|nr:serine/threonine protein kinase [Bacteroidota bacterium]
MKFQLLVIALLLQAGLFAQQSSFRFAFVTDTHIGSPNGAAEEDLRRTVQDINEQKDLAFVLLTGDITELGTQEELLLAKKILDSLKIPWYIIPGNHDTGWSESGGLGFTQIFGMDRFSFSHGGIQFIGCASGPYVRMSDGHVPRDAVNWLDSTLAALPDNSPLVMVNHYPLDNSLDNWYEVTDRVRKKNIALAICGHGHANKKMDFEGIPGVMGRSNLRAKAEIGGYNIVEWTTDSVFFAERRPGRRTLPVWNVVSLQYKSTSASINYPRPSYTINSTYQKVKRVWEVADQANIISTPAWSTNWVVVGNQAGFINGYAAKTGKRKWQFATQGPIYSSPAIQKNNVVVGSADGAVYCLQLQTGKLQWKWQARAAVLGSPVIAGDTVYIGTSDHRVVALHLQTGKLIWQFEELEGPVVSTPLLADGKVIIGAWDRHLYAIEAASGALAWKWNNGSMVRNFSPASCIPVVSNGTVFIMAPDRFTTAIDLATGQTRWRVKDGGVRESIGISKDGKWIFGKSMQDTLVAYQASANPQVAAWKMHVGFGYEHVPSMIIEQDGELLFGTRNGVIYAVDPNLQKVNWAHKLDNSMVNTVRPVGKNKVLVATMDGKLALLQSKH